MGQFPRWRVLMLRYLFSAPKGHRKIARGFQPLGPEREREPGAGSPWLLSVAPLGPERIVWLRLLAQRTRGWKPLAIVGSPVGASKDCVVARLCPADQGLEPPGYFPSPRSGRRTTAQHQNCARRVNVRRIVAHHYIWKPSPEIVEYSNIGRFMRRHGITSYRELIDRSTSEIEWFWKAAVEDLDIQFFRPFDAVLDASRGIAWTQWFCGGTINLAHQCLDRHALSGRHEHTAVIAEAEDGTTSDLSYGELHAQTCRLADALANLGIRQGDAIGLFLPMIPEAVIGFLACAKLARSPCRFSQASARRRSRPAWGTATPKRCSPSRRARRRGHRVDMQAVALEAARACPSVRHVIVSRRPQVDGLERKPHDPAILDWGELVRTASAGRPSAALDPETPVLIAYTSGTTGRPKGAVHVHGGFLVKIAQEVAHQVDMHPDDILFWVTDLGWIMGPWEITGALAAGGTVVLAEGAPDYPAPDRVWSIVERHRVSILGVSPTLIRALARHGQEPLAAHDLSRLRILASTGEAWDPESWRWLFEKAGGKRCPIINISGGTEVGAVCSRRCRSHR